MTWVFECNSIDSNFDGIMTCFPTQIVACDTGMIGRKGDTRECGTTGPKTQESGPKDDSHDTGERWDVGFGGTTGEKWVGKT
jgi:hypothetical protein